MIPPRTTPQVTVEQLLRLKRAERPEPGFWQQFERDLRIKQLAAIVEPRPWWAPFIRISARVVRYQLPVGATAILALTFLTVREYRLPEAMDAQFSPGVVVTKVDTVPGPAVPVVMPVKQSNAMEQADRTESIETVAISSRSDSHPAEQSASMGMTPDQVSDMMPMLSGGAQLEETYSPAARVIAANLEAVKASAPALAQMIEHVSGMDALLTPRAKTQAVDPLARVRPSSGSRRLSRLLASALTAGRYSSDNIGERVSANRLNRTLTEERLYDNISRIGIKAHRVAISF